MIFKSKTDPLGIRQHDPVQRWKDDSQRQEEAFAGARRERDQAEQRRADAIAANEAAQLRAAFEQRLAALEEKGAETDAMLADVFRAVSGAFNDLGSQRMELSAEQREEIRELKVEVAKLGSTLAELREERTKDFQFAREKDGGDLPNFLPQRRVVN